RLEQRIRHSIEREATQQERNRLAHELHDTLAQSLGHLSLALDGLASRLEPVDEEASAVARDLRGRARNALDELRRSLLSMSPAELERRSLVEAIEAALAELERQEGIRTSLDLAGDRIAVEEQPAPVRATVFRIFQEALAN